MRHIIKSNSLSLSVLFLVIIICTITLSVQNQGDFIIFLNSFFSPSLNLVFKNITHLGDGLFIVSASLIILILYKINIGLSLLISYIISGLPVMAIKRIINAPRPKAYLDNFLELRLMDNYYYAASMSFPSGHTASALAFFLLLSLLVKNQSAKLAFMLLGLIIGLSRMYLLQHFLKDVLVGTIWGSLIAIITYLLYQKYNSDKLNQSAISYFKNK